MNSATRKDIEVWEGEGGAIGVATLSGTANQVEWAKGIRRLVNADFDRVAAAFRLVANKQAAGKRAETETIIGILEDKRAEVMSREQAGYFIHDWQTIGDQVRQMIFSDPRYQAIQRRRAAGRRETADTTRIGAPRMIGIRPLYDRIVVRRIEEEAATSSGIVLPDSAKEKSQKGEVIAVGRGKKLEDGSVVALEVKAGDRIVFEKYSGSETELEGTEYIIIHEDDVIGVFTSTVSQSDEAPESEPYTRKR